MGYNVLQCRLRELVMFFMLGNISLMFVTVGLFVATIKLGRRES